MAHNVTPADQMRRAAAKAQAAGDHALARQYESDARAYDRKAAGAKTISSIAVAINKITEAR